ncbi:MAG: glucose 1-dehydrogenase [Hamadaea sp.]|nr:glucose 1-dehydrogenase [Hamadaea sp.]
MGRLDGKTALITGGARGMGKAHVKHFVAEGARVVFGDVLDDKGRALAETLGDAVRYVTHDVTNEDAWAAAVATAVETFGGLDILVNNAGILMHRPIAEMSAEDFRRVLEVNAVGTWLGVKAVIEAMSAGGGGSIVNVSSIEGIAGAGGLSAYSASKFAVRGITRSAAQELGALGIRVNSVHPGGIMTPMAMAAADVFRDIDPAEFFKRMPIPRFGESVEVSRLVAFLASDEASYCTGAEFVADGGLLSGPGY